MVGNKKLPLSQFMIPHPQTGDHAINGIVVLSGGPIKKKQVIKDAKCIGYNSHDPLSYGTTHCSGYGWKSDGVRHSVAISGRPSDFTNPNL